MKHLLFFLVIALHCNLVFAQRSKSIRVKAGEDLAQAYSPQGFYRFPQFSKVVLHFKGGNKNTWALFNYNMLSGNMQFINPKGDTLDMTNAASIDSVVFEKNIFIYDEGFVEVITQSDSFKLLKRLVLKTQVENIGAYGLSNTTGSITSISSYTIRSGVYSLIVNQDVVLDETISWFFKNGNNKMLKANNSNLFKLLPPKKQQQAQAYLNKNKTSFEKEDDLKKLMEAIQI